METLRINLKGFNITENYRYRLHQFVGSYLESKDLEKYAKDMVVHIENNSMEYKRSLIFEAFYGFHSTRKMFLFHACNARVPIKVEQWCEMVVAIHTMLKKVNK